MKPGVQISIQFLDPFPDNSRAALLLHGLGADGDSWRFQFPTLGRAGYRPLAPDLPGFGGSVMRPSSKWSIDQVLASIIRYLDTEYRLGHYDVIGWSLGGALAVRMAIHHPERIRRLVLVNTFACLRPRTLTNWYYLARRFLIANLQNPQSQAEIVARRIFPKPEQKTLRTETARRICSADPIVYRKAMRSIVMFDERKNLHRIGIPTLVVSGDRDTTVDLQIQRELAEHIPGARHVILRDAGHAAPIDQPEIFNRRLLEFLDAG